MKKLASLILTVCMLLALLNPLAVSSGAAATTTSGDVDQSMVNQRIGELQAKLENKYFTIDGIAANDNGDDRCYLPNVLSSTNKSCPLYGMRKPSSTNNIPGHYLWSGGSCVLGGKTGYSCYGFANYALWYVFSQTSTDVVRVNKVVEGVLDYNTMAVYAQPGDVIRIRYKGMSSTKEHSLMISQITENYIAGIDCNNTGKEDSKVLVSKISYTGSWGGKPIVISRASNAIPTGGISVGTPTASAFSNGTAVSVNWNKIAEAVYYDVYLLQTPYGWEDVKYSTRVSASETTYCFSNVTPGEYYAFVIARPNKDTNQSNWVAVTVTPDASVPIVNASSVGNQITVNWNACANATSYNVYLLYGGEDWSNVKYSVTTTKTSYTFDNVDYGTYIAFVVSKPNLDSTQSNWVEVTATNKYQSLTYTLSKGEITIVDCLDSASGKIAIPSSIGGYPVTSIANSAFQNCALLTSVEIPNSVITIGNSAFAYCESLTSILIPEGVTRIEDCAFFGCSALSNIKVSNSIEYIGDSAFAYCTSLLSFDIPESMNNIVGQTFYGCTNLQSVTIPQNVSVIKIGAFKNCLNLTIYGYAGSVAETYANENNIPFEAIEEEIVGDLDGDGAIGVTDLTLLARYFAGWGVEVDSVAVDMNGDGEASVDDLTLFARHVAGWDVTIG